MPSIKCGGKIAHVLSYWMGKMATPIPGSVWISWSVNMGAARSAPWETARILHSLFKSRHWRGSTFEGWTNLEAPFRWCGFMAKGLSNHRPYFFFQRSNRVWFWYLLPYWAERVHLGSCWPHLFLFWTLCSECFAAFAFLKDILKLCFLTIGMNY